MQAAPDFLLDIALEGVRIPGAVAVEVVGADPETVSGRHVEYPFQRLRANFQCFKLLLLLLAAAIRGVPVAKIRLQATGWPGDTPVGDFMQGAAEITMGKEDAVMGATGVGGLVKGLVVAVFKAGIVADGKFVVENLDQVVG